MIESVILIFEKDRFDLKDQIDLYQDQIDLYRDQIDHKKRLIRSKN